MTRATLVLVSPDIRQKAARWASKLPDGTRITFQEPKRTLPANAKLWACLTDISEQVPWHGIKLSPDDYKLLFMDALKRELRIVPNIDGTGFVNLGRSSSNLSKDEFGMLLELVQQFGANHGVVFHDHEPVA